jgi:hypothetical protein
MKEIIDIRNWIRTNGEMSEDGKTITYKCDEIEKVITDALQQVKNCNKADVSNTLPDFRDVIKARIDYFKSIYHTYEAAELQNALNTIQRLVPPINFQIGQ